MTTMETADVHACDLSRNEREVLLIIEQWQRVYGRMPLVRQITEVSTESGMTISQPMVSAHLQTLERLGLIKRDRHVHRAIEITDSGRRVLGEALEEVYDE